MRPQTLMDSLDFHAEHQEPCGVIGPPGVGKSEMVIATSRKKLPKNQIIVMNLVNRDPTDLSGLPFLVEIDDGNGKRRVVDWVKQKQFLTQRPITLFLDELFQAPVQTQNVAAPIILEKRVDDIILPEGSWVVFASNRQEDKAGTNRVPSHIPNRCTVYFGPDIHTDDWADWALNHGVDIRVIQFIRMKPKSLHDFDPGRLVNATPRQWAWVGRYLERMPAGTMYDTIAGRVGDGYSAELKGFLKYSEQLPNKDLILSQPKKAPVPTEPSALYLVTGMLAQAANAKTFDAIATYADRMPPEFQAMLVKDAMRLAPEITNTKAFVSWGVKFAEVLR